MTPADPRRCDRMPFTAGLTVIHLADRRRSAGNAIDISRGGMQLFAERFLPAGTRVRIHVALGGRGQRTHAELLATVRWARPEAGGGIMGAEFDAVITGADQPEIWELLCTAWPAEPAGRDAPATGP